MLKKNSTFSLFGVGQSTGYKQFGLIIAGTPLTMFAGYCCTVGIGLWDTGSHDIDYAEDMPIQLKNDYLISGKADIYGDRPVTHGKVGGTIFPPEVQSSLGAAMPVLNDCTTGFWVKNQTSDSYQKMYDLTKSTYVNILRYKSFWMHDELLIAPGAVNETYVRTATWRGKGDGPYAPKHYRWDFESSAYTAFLECEVTGNLKHFNYGTSDKVAGLSRGNYRLGIYTKATSTWSYSSSQTSSGLTFIALTPPTTLSHLNSHLILSGIKSRARENFNSILSEMAKSDNSNSLWKATTFAYESIKFQELNWSEFIRDTVIHWRELIPDLKTFRKIASPKSWAQLYLYYSYAVRPTIGDTKNLITAIDRIAKLTHKQLVAYLSQTHVVYGTSYDRSHFVKGEPLFQKANARLRVRLDLEPERWFDFLLGIMYLLDIDVDPLDVWNLIGYSFVVDWFVNTKEVFSYVKSLYDCNRYKLKQIVWSHKRVCTLPAQKYDGSSNGIFKFTTYERSVGNTFPFHPFELRFTDPSNHWLEGAALLLVRRK